MSHHTDPVDAALELLRSDDHLELPPPFDPRGNEPAPLRRSMRLLPALLVVTGLGAVAAAASFESLRALWYRIAVDGQEVSGLIQGTGEHSAEFTTDDGCHVTVRVLREQQGDATSTGLRVTQEGPGRELEEEFETTTSAPAREVYTRAELVGSARLHEWRDAHEVRWALHLGPDPHATGSRLLLHEVDSTGSHPVTLLARTERALGRGGRAQVTEGPLGGVSVVLDDGRGGVFEFAVAPTQARRPIEYRSPDGRVQVRLED